MLESTNLAEKYVTFDCAVDCYLTSAMQVCFGYRFIIPNKSKNSPLHSDYHRNNGITWWYLTNDIKTHYIRTNSGTHTYKGALKTHTKRNHTS